MSYSTSSSGMSLFFLGGGRVDSYKIFVRFKLDLHIKFKFQLNLRFFIVYINVNCMFLCIYCVFNFCSF